MKNLASYGKDYQKLVPDLQAIVDLATDHAFGKKIAGAFDTAIQAIMAIAGVTGIGLTEDLLAVDELAGAGEAGEAGAGAGTAETPKPPLEPLPPDGPLPPEWGGPEPLPPDGPLPPEVIEPEPVTPTEPPVEPGPEAASRLSHRLWSHHLWSRHPLSHRWNHPVKPAGEPGTPPTILLSIHPRIPQIQGHLPMDSTKPPSTTGDPGTSNPPPTTPEPITSAPTPDRCSRPK